MEKGIPIRSVSRSLTVLKVINQHGSLNMKEVAQYASLPYPTTCRIIQTLIHEGFVEQEPSRKRYRPTVLVKALSQGYARDGRLIEAARPEIQQITDYLGWPVSITTRVGSNMVLRDSTHAQTSMTFECYYPGFTLPVVDCASGRLVLAYAAPEELKHLVAGQQVNGEAIETVEDAERLLSLSEIRENGFSWMGRCQASLTPGRTSSIAVPIFENGAVTAALALIYFHNSVTYRTVVTDYLPILKQKAHAISEKLAPTASWSRPARRAGHSTFAEPTLQEMLQ